MSTVAPPPPPPPPIPQASAQPTAVVSNPPPGLTSVAAGTRIDAIIVATTPDGRAEVETRLGRFLLQANVALPKEGPIQLQIQTLARTVSVLITSIHGKPPAAALRILGLTSPATPVAGAATSAAGAPTGAGTAATQATGTGPAAAAGTAAPVQLTAGSTVSATLLHPTQVTPSAGGVITAAGTAAGAATAPAAAGTGSNPANANPPPLATQPTAITGAQASAAYGRGQATPATPGGTVTVPAGNAFTVRITALQPPVPRAAPPAPPPNAGTPIAPGLSLLGVVVNAGSTGQTVAQTHAGPVSLATATPLPVGTTVQLEVVTLPRPDPAGLNGGVANRLGHAILEGRQWPALDETFNFLRESNPGAAQQLLNGVLPRPDAALAANVLMFLLGIRAGEVRAWLGDSPMRALQRLRPDLMNRLRDDFSNLGRLVDEPLPNDWRAIPVPMANGGAIEQIHLYLQRRQDDEEDEEDPRQGPGTRFVVDLDLTRMGHLQLDGFVQDGTKRFDLIVRTDARLPDKVQNDIRTIFTEVNEATGITGGLVFQSAPANFIRVAGGASPAGLGLVV